jgi:hypothetical protein
MSEETEVLELIFVESVDNEGTIGFHPASMKDEPAVCESAI